MAEAILQVKHLSKSFAALTATDNVSLDILEGEVHSIIGPNGAGKSTLVGLICGWIKPDAGGVWLAGNNITGHSVARRSLAGLGRSFQVSCLAMELSARRNVMLSIQARQGGSFRFWKAVRSDASLINAADQVLEQLNIDKHGETPAGQLSHGKRRELEVACALALKPKVLILDEPMAGLDQQSTAGLIDFLRQIKKDIPVLLIEHDMNAVFALSDRISVLVYGSIIETGTADQIKSSEQVKEAYLGTGSKQ